MAFEIYPGYGSTSSSAVLPFVKLNYHIVVDTEIELSNTQISSLLKANGATAWVNDQAVTKVWDGTAWIKFK